MDNRLVIGSGLAVVIAIGVWCVATRPSGGDGIARSGVAVEPVRDGADAVAGPGPAEAGSSSDALSTGGPGRAEPGRVPGPVPDADVPRAGERRLPVRIEVRTSGSRRAASVPDVRVEVGVARGRIHRRTPPVHDLQVLAEVVADAEGNAALPLELPEDFGTAAAAGEDEQELVVARVVESGYQARWSGADLPRLASVSDDAEPLVLRVQARSGSTVRGRLLTPDGGPAPHGRILFFRTEPDGSIDYAYREEAFAGRGRFEVHLGEAGTWNVKARARNVGAVGRRALDLAPFVAGEELVLRLEGSGVLAGRVVDPSGDPLPRYQLWAVPASQPDANVGTFRDPVLLPFEWEGGTYDGHVTTDDDGRFRFEGLAPGAFRVRGTLAGSGYYDALLTPTPVETGAEDLELVVARHALHLTVRDAEGEVVETSSLSWSRWEALRSARSYVHVSDGAGNVTNPREEAEGRRTELPDGVLSIEVEPRQHYVVGVATPHHPPVEREVFVDPGRFVQAVELVLPPAHASGTLRIEVQDPEGARVEEHTRVTLHAASGRELFDSGRYHRGGAHELVLAPGRYDAVVAAPPLRGNHGSRISEARFAPVRVEVDVLSDQVLELPVRLGGAARLAVTVRLQGEPGLVDPTSVPRDSVYEDARRNLSGVFVHVRAKGEGAWQALEFDRSADVRTPVNLGGDVLTPWVVPDRTERAVDPLPTGPYDVRLQREGYEPEVREVTIPAKGSASLEVTLTPNR